MEISEDLQNYMDKNKTKVISWPAKAGKQLLVLSFLADKFELAKFYTEKEVNEILNNYHSFGDPALLRRELYVKEFFNRELDGSKYWRVK